MHEIWGSIPSPNILNGYTNSNALMKKVIVLIGRVTAGGRSRTCNLKWVFEPGTYSGILAGLMFMTI